MHLAGLREQELGKMPREERPLGGGPTSVEDSVSALKRQLGKSPDGSSIERAWALADEGLLTEAEVEFAKLLVGNPRVEPSIEFGRFLARIGRLNQAAGLFESATKVAEGHGDLLALGTAYRNLGTVLDIRGDLDGAERMYRKGLNAAE